MRSRSLLALVLLSVSSCAHAAPSRPPPGDSALERALLEDAADRRFDRLGMLDAALIASGVSDRAELARLSKAFAAELDPVVASLPRDPAKAGRALLVALHQGVKGRRALLRAYDAQATTLLDILETGRFNCVSSAALYLIAAERAGLSAWPVLMPMHARAALELGGGRSVIVETTVARGFDPPPATLAQVAARVRPARADGAVDLYADERGTRVDFPALLGAVSTNLAVQARERGELDAVAAYDKRSEALVTADARALVRRLRASTLGELAMRSLGEGRTLEALALFEQAARVVGGSPEEPIFLHNLVAVGQKRADELSRTEPEARLLAFPDRFSEWPQVRREVASYALQRAGIARGERGDHEGMARLMREAAALGGKDAQRAARNVEVAEHNASAQRQNRTAAELEQAQQLADSDPDAAWARFSSAFVPADADAELSRFRRGVGAYVAARRTEKAAREGRCAQADAAAGDWRAMLDSPSDVPARLQAACRSDEGNQLFAAGRFEEALRLHREALQLAPGDPAHARNVVACLGNLASAHARAGRCDLARPLLDEARRLAPDEEGIAQLQRACAGR